MPPSPTLGATSTYPPSPSPSSPLTRVGTPVEGVVSVKTATEEFEVLRRELTNSSQLHRIKTGQKDLEKDEQDFDLLSFMRSEGDKRDAGGYKRKVVGAVWTGLSVTGVGGVKIYVRTFPDAVKEFALGPVNALVRAIWGKPAVPKKLLHEFNGYARPGEMVLVLGRPGSGCTTFLKTIANQRAGFLGVDGEVRYGGIGATEMGDRYKGEVVYNQEDDVHQATLTVGQTILFALSTKTPGNLLPNESHAKFRNQVAELLLKMLGISHTRDTQVGSAYVRGVSGGERKRVSIAEMMATRASICSWDNSTRGLDASTALDYVKALRIMTDVNHTTTFVSLYQAGEGIYEQFDKVLVIDEGRQVYFGPRQEARKYMTSLGFLDLPRQTTAAFLTGCTDPNERQISPGYSASKVPTTPEALESTFSSSEICSRMIEEREAFMKETEMETGRREDFVEAVQSEKRRGVSHKSVYTVSFFTQVRTLAVRQFQIKMQDKLGLFTSFFTALSISLIAGSVYYQLPQSAAGAFTRGGVIFISILFNSFQAFNELPTQMLGRPIMWKHAGFTFYRPAALTLASTIADAPVNAAKIFLFVVIIYFMAGLSNSAGAFFTFYVVVLAGYFALAAFFRLLGTLCSSFDVAARLASFLITGMIIYGGYIIPVFSMKRWLFWIYYINPLNYAFAAAMENEFGRINLTCDGTYVTPSNIGNITKYPATLGPNQVCSLPGAMGGSAIVTGSQYVKAHFDYDTGDVWRNFGITIAFFIFFNLIQAWAVERFRHGADSPQINVFARENKRDVILNEELQKNKDAFRRGEAVQDLSNLIQTRKPLTWEDLTYTVPVAGGTRVLLDQVYGYVQPGTLTCLMGASGAGKTTLLDVLANRKNIGVIGGSILIDGRPLSVDFQRSTAYVEQQDTHESTATVREALRFSAYLRQPAHVPRDEKDRYVEEVIQLLELEDLADAMIGNPGFGLGVEARKRVTIGVELASKPQLLLFLDEPTSGLDSQSAFNIVRFLRKLASAGQAILVTVHQPDSFLFEHFDRLLLLTSSRGGQGGKCVYFGEIGKDSNVLRSYLAKHGALCPEDANPAEYMLEAIGAGSRRQIGNRDWSELWTESEELIQVKREIEELKATGLSHPEVVSAEGRLEYATSLMDQIKVVGKRTTLSFWRNPDYGLTRLLNHISIALFVTLTFLNLGNSLADLQYRVFAIFFVSIIPAIIISQVEPTFIMARGIFTRESSSKMYSQKVFALAQLAAEIPYSFICAVAFFLLFYFPIGFNRSPSRAGYQFLMILVTEFFAVTLGQAVGALSPSVFIAASLNPFLLVIFSLFLGVTVPYYSLPGFWRSWMYELDPLTRLIAGMVGTELHNLPVTCLPNEFRTFFPPAGQTCQEWAGEFVSLAGGYIQDPLSTISCQYCQFAVGDQFYAPLNINFDNRWRDLGILFAFACFNGLITIFASLKYSRR